MVAQLRWPTTPAAEVTAVSTGSTSGVMLWNTMSSSDGHAASFRCLFGFLRGEEEEEKRGGGGEKRRRRKEEEEEEEEEGVKRPGGRRWNSDVTQT
jgi:hypothetical protein